MGNNWHYIWALLDCQQPHNKEVYVWAANSQEAQEIYMDRPIKHINEVVVVQPLDREERKRIEQRMKSEGVLVHDAKRKGYVALEAIVNRKLHFQPKK